MTTRKVPFDTWQHIGNVGVDAGLIMVGDPCYVTGDSPANQLVHDWDEFCDYIRKDENTIHHQVACGLPYALGHMGAGVVVSSGYGDGEYPVYAKFSDEDDWGIRIKELKVVFIEEE